MIKRVLGIDVGFTNLGAAVITTPNSLVYNSLISTKKYTNLGLKLLHIYKELSLIIETHSPCSICYEMPVKVPGKNGPKLLAVVGIIELLAAQHDLDIQSKTATEIKKRIAGTGSADKQDIENAVNKILQKTSKPYYFSTDHESDAAAIALCADEI